MKYKKIDLNHSLAHKVVISAGVHDMQQGDVFWG